MTRSQEILSVMKLKWQAIGITQTVARERIEAHLEDIKELENELREIQAGDRADQAITL
jgi:hypothetical protein